MTDQRLAPSAVAEEVREAAAELLPLLCEGKTGQFALTVSGSLSKNTSDELSDVDFRFYSEHPVGVHDSGWQRRWEQLRERWAERGLRLDELWFRTIAEVDETIDQWLAGGVAPDELIWTVWGYHPLTDLARQVAVVDKDGLVERWRDRLELYPASVRDATIRRHLGPLLYWRDDYHYENKAIRGDVVFLAGLTSALVHRILQVLAALNRVYYPGDGNNLVMADSFTIVPTEFSARVTEILAPAAPGRDFIGQRARLVTLIDEVEDLVARHTAAKERFE
ncbi:DUF4037 domain-containing protein [Cryobacterium sp. SO2]|uniref:DUF4037 domain-containing protein n=1 Tax=Cryobacterium sp. SO2 TaxID=1897060 RepID=UPI00223E76F2|nr:DUF4037 domain-containing protein [Cryobacterium sp. SO2]WEO77310.1 DUF4037 domain-containing protein [Cryobacterium sp. SO2]